jgi:hypothetical protein
MNQSDDYVGNLLQVARVDAAHRLRRQQAMVRRLLDELDAGLVLVPPDAGTFWRSEAHRAYARRLRDLRRMLAHARVGLHDALASIDSALATLAALAPAAPPP